jgi:predicted PP-loop superfamily ATPase
MNGGIVGILVILVLSTAAVIAACGRSDEWQAAAIAPGAGSPMKANNKLEEAVRARLDTDEQLRTANLSISADVTKNEVTLSGTVDSEATRSKAVELAKSAQVGVIVNDKIKVKPRRSNTAPQEQTAYV